ncbi:DUF4349 domain-containing protein [Candidatus Woesearchaeota archaeon]|nr:DUF4349 domain-containing protein [Candidatus Woesearchaeota archaeon]
MALKNQFLKLKDNWLLILVVVVILGAFSFTGGGSNLLKSVSYGADMGIAESVAYARGVPSPGYDSFAPEVEERKITKTASLTTEIERGEYDDAEAKLKAIVTSSDSYLLSDSVSRHGEGWKQYRTGYYSFKVETDKYGAVLTQLKEIGEVQSFNENANDITGTYTDTETQLALEKERLERYQEMYAEATDVEDKINLNDRIFNQERTIKYYEDYLENLDKRVDYSTVSVSLREEASGYANVAFVKFSELVNKLVNSINSLFKLLFYVVPWAVVIWIIWLISKPFRKK